MFDVARDGESPCSHRVPTARGTRRRCVCADLAAEIKHLTPVRIEQVIEAKERLRRPGRGSRSRESEDRELPSKANSAANAENLTGPAGPASSRRSEPAGRKVHQ